jgi:hypothetical protein
MNSLAENGTGSSPVVHRPVNRKRRRANPEEYVRKRVASLKPSPENTRLYRPTREDPGISMLADSMKKNGCDPLVITLDNYIVSGHRRHAALQLLGQKWCTCKVLPFRRSDKTADEYLLLLREYNHQRNKTVAEQVNEELVDLDPTEAYGRLCVRRSKSLFAPEHNGVAKLEIEGEHRRYSISAVKDDHVKLIKKVVFEDRKDYWPLSVRGVHYALLNYDFLRNTQLALKYLNDQGSYDATSDLITRLREAGELPWRAFDDPTRPLKVFDAFPDAKEFVWQELRHLFGGYWRDLMQSQPNHVEVVCEKNTIYHMVNRVTSKYQIPTSSARGFNSSDAWYDLSERYQSSEKKRLIVIVLSDYDPEGERIPHVCGKTLRDCFNIHEELLTVVKAGVTRQQVERYKLPTGNFAKETSSNYDWFVERNGGDDTVWELEALDPKAMMDDLDAVIRGVIDVDLYNREVEREREDAAYLERKRAEVARLLKQMEA